MVDPSEVFLRLCKELEEECDRRLSVGKLWVDCSGIDSDVVSAVIYKYRDKGWDATFEPIDFSVGLWSSRCCPKIVFGWPVAQKKGHPYR
jgi:hypothetical protein